MKRLSPTPRCATLLLSCLFCGAWLPACGSEDLQADPLAPVLVIGIDGLEWEVLRPLMQDGRCPNLKALAERGSYGKLGTFQPTWSPVVWTSIATGKSMEQHRILSFVDKQGRAFTSSRREGRALWNIADRYGLTSNVFGWWITWPVEPIRGVMVSGTSAAAQIKDNWKPALMPGLEEQVSPPELADQVFRIAEQAGAQARVLELARERVFGAYPEHIMGPVEQRLIDQTLWSIVSDETFFQVAKALMPGHPADLNMVYFGGPDVAGHRFWRQAHPEGYAYQGSTPEADEVLSHALDNYYVWVDDMVGELVSLAGEGTTVFVVSDHGMHAIAQGAPNPNVTTGDHQDGTPGVIIAAGPGVLAQGGMTGFLKSGALPVHGNVYVLAPTILGLLGIPGAQDMQGRVYRNILTEEARQRIKALEGVKTHDEGFREASMVAMSAEAEKQFMERMKALGYLDQQDQDQSRLVDPTQFGRDEQAAGGLGQPPSADPDERPND